MGHDATPLIDAEAHPKLGINAERGCTDICATFLFFIFWVAMLALAGVSFVVGKPSRLVYGTDYLGNTCGHGSPSDIQLEAGTSWSDYDKLWYPITFDYKRKKMVILDALDLGICVRECPQRSDRKVVPYGPTANGAPSEWPVLFDSSVTFHRCVPDFLSFDCQNGTECFTGLVNAKSEFLGGVSINDLAQRGFSEVMDAWWVILVGLLIVIILSFLWLLVLRRLVKPVVVLTMAVVFVALVGLGGFFFYMRHLALTESPPAETSGKYFLAAAIVSWIFSLLYVVLIIFLAKDIMTACDIIEEATKVPIKIPTMVLIPPVSMAFVLPIAALHITVAVFIQGASDTLDVSLPTPDFLNSTNGGIAGISPPNISQIISAQKYTIPNWRIPAHIYNLFMFLWGFGFLNAIGFLIIALCGVYWYWSRPGDDKNPPDSAVATATRTILRYHVGTAALGSFIVAVVQIIRVIVLVFEKKLQAANGGEEAEAQKFIFRCIHCCLACLERIVKFINKNAYVVCAMTGHNFITSARKGLELLMANALSVSAVTIISEYVMTFGKVLVTILGTFLSWLMLAAARPDYSIAGAVIVLVIIFLVGFLISSVFTAVFSVCIDTILLCFCYDKAEDGRDYYPSDLRAHIDKGVLERGEELDAQERLKRIQEQGLGANLTKNTGVDSDVL